MMQTSALTSTKLRGVEVLGVDDGGVDVGEDLELVARSARRSRSWTCRRTPACGRRRSFTWPGSNGSIMPCSSAMRRIHLSDLMLTWCTFPLRTAEDGASGEHTCSRQPLPAGGQAATARSAPRSSQPQRLVARPARQPAGRIAGDVAITRGQVRIGHRRHGRLAAVGLLADADVQRQAAQQRHVVLLAHALPPPAPKICSSWPQFEHTWVAMFSTMPSTGTSTFWNIFKRLARIQQGDVLRRGDDHRAGHRHLLRQGQLDVAGARRQVDDQVVQLVPAGVVEQLRQRLGDHRPAPDHRRLLLHQQADRHDLQAVRGHRLDASCRRASPGDPPRPACAAGWGRRCRHRARPRARPRRPAPGPGWPPRWTCPRRPCPRPRR